MFIAVLNIRSERNKENCIFEFCSFQRKKFHPTSRNGGPGMQLLAARRTKSVLRALGRELYELQGARSHTFLCPRCERKEMLEEWRARSSNTALQECVVTVFFCYQNVYFFYFLDVHYFKISSSVCEHFSRIAVKISFLWGSKARSIWYSGGGGGWDILEKNPCSDFD